MSERWIRFPLALLGYAPADPKSTVEAIMSYALWVVGGSGGAIDFDDVALYAWGEQSGRKYDEENEDEVRILRGSKILNVHKGSCTSDVKMSRLAQRYLDGAGKAANVGVNLNMAFFWRAYFTAGDRIDNARASGGEISFRDFRFLCALLSKIGSHKFDKIGWQEIQARAAGFAGKQDLRQAQSGERNRRRSLILTQDQIRTTRDSLERGNWFVRVKWSTTTCGANGGESWYSFSTAEKGLRGRAELAGWIAERKAKWKEVREDNRTSDVDLVAEAIAKRQAARPAKPPREPKVEKAACPNINRDDPWESPSEAPAEPHGMPHENDARPVAMPEPRPMCEPNPSPKATPNPCPNPCPNINDRRGINDRSVLTREVSLTKEDSITKEACDLPSGSGSLLKKEEEGKPAALAAAPPEEKNAMRSAAIFQEAIEKMEAAIPPEPPLERWQAFLVGKGVSPEWAALPWRACRSWHSEYAEWEKIQPAPAHAQPPRIKEGTRRAKKKRATKAKTGTCTTSP